MSSFCFHLLKLLSNTGDYVAFISHLFLLLVSFVTVVHICVIYWNILQPVDRQALFAWQNHRHMTWDPYFVGGWFGGAGYAHMNPKQKITFPLSPHNKKKKEKVKRVLTWCTQPALPSQWNENRSLDERRPTLKGAELYSGNVLYQCAVPLHQHKRMIVYILR